MTRRGLSALFAALALLVFLVVPAAASAATGGSLRPLSTNSCITAFVPTGTPCVQGRGMEELYPEIAISPDGKHIYTANSGKSAVTVHDRDAATGAITQKDGGAGCFYDSNESDVPAGCTAVAGGFLGAGNVVVSPDGRHVYVAGSKERTVATFTRNLDTGVLTYAGCVGQLAGCSPGRRMDGILEVAISADGFYVYAAARGTGADDGSILTLKRDGATGLLTLDTAAPSCLSHSTVNACTFDAAIKFPREIVLSPDNAFVYVGDATGQVVAYSRNRTSGVLERVGCIAAAAIADCTVFGPIGNSPENLAISPDATKLYVTSYLDGELHTLARAADGTLAPIPSACFTEAPDADCPNAAPNLKTAYGLTAVDKNIYVAINDHPSGSGGSILTFDVGADGLPVAKPIPFGCVHRSSALCTTVGGMTGMLDVIASPDKRHVYSYGSGTLIGTARDAGPACLPPSGTVEAGKVISLQLECSDPEGDPIAYEILSQPSSGVLGTPDGAGRVSYAAPSDAGDRSVTFTYRAHAYGGTSEPATATIRISAPRPPVTIARIVSTVSHRWRHTARTTTVTRLIVKVVPAGATITIACKIKGRGKKCPFKKITKRVKTASAKVNLLPSIKKKKRRFSVGARIELRVVAPGHIGKTMTFRVRRSKVPSVKGGCIPLGSTKVHSVCP